MKIVPVILARADSTRLPGKVLSPIYGERSIIQHLCEQVYTLARENDCIAAPILATSCREPDDEIANFGELNGIEVHRGDLQPLIRLCEIASSRQNVWLWRLNADSPLILFPLIRHVADIRNKIDDATPIITNLVHRTFPYGISLEMFRSSWLDNLEKTRFTLDESEHITHIRDRVDKPNIYGVEAKDIGLSAFKSDVRLTIDYDYDADFFNSLWNKRAFTSTEIGSIERITYAYKERQKL
jgi:spore coat polysaccharide biosynthesis protein SpsF